MSGAEDTQQKYNLGQAPKKRSPWAFDLNPSQLVMALALIAVGAAGMLALRGAKLVIGGKNFTSIALLLSGLIFYCGLLAIVAMFRNETYLSIAILLPSVVAVAIFVYGFIGWSIRVSLSKW